MFVMHFKVVSNQNITPNSQDKDIYQLVLTPQDDTLLEYQAGDWLTLQAPNQPEWVAALLEALSLSGNELIELRRVGSVSVRQALTHHLEITQLNPAILNKLQRQHQIGDWADRDAMINAAYGRDILDLLALFPVLKTWGVALLALLSPLAPRYYSIASVPVAVGNAVHLVVKKVMYANLAQSERTHFGVASYAVSQLQTGDVVECALKRNPTFQLPEDDRTPIIMIGAGTGIAPFIGFLQQRIADHSAGSNTLFFGEVHQACSFLYQDFLEACAAQQNLTLFTAFSRDQAKKIYVQNRLVENADWVWSLIKKGANIYICGSQYGLAEAVKATFLELIMQFESVDIATAKNTWQTWRKQKRLQTDVY